MQQRSAAAVRHRDPAPPGAWLRPWPFAFLLALLVFASFPQAFLGEQSFVSRDFGFFAYPLAAYQRECFWHGELPFWNPYNNCGVPFLAQWNTMPLYPPTLLYLLFPLAWGLTFFSLAHLFFAGLGMYFLVRRWTGNPFAAAVAGLAFSFNGFSLNLLMWPSHIATLSWMPWMVLLLERAVEEGGGVMVLTALAGTLQMLAGSPELILFTWTIGLGFCLTRIVLRQFGYPCGPAEPKPGVLLLRFLGVWLLVLALSAAQLLPFLDLAVHSERQTGYADARWSMPGTGWANFFVPMAFGSTWKDGIFFQNGQAWTSSYYLGVGILLLGLLAFRARANWKMWLLAAWALASVALAMGEHSLVYRLLRRMVPQVSLMTYPIKFVAFAVFALPPLAGFGLDALMRNRADAQAKKAMTGGIWILSAILLATITGILLWISRLASTAETGAAISNGLGRATFLALETALLLWLLATVRPGRIPQVAALPFLILLLALWTDVLRHEPEQNPTAPPWIYQGDLARQRLKMSPQPELGKSRAMVSPSAEDQFIRIIMADVKDNYLVKRLGYFADCNLLDHVPKVDGFFSLYPGEIGDVTSLLYSATNAFFPRLSDFMGVSQMTAEGKFFDWTVRKTAMPLISAGQRPIFVEDKLAMASLARGDFSPSAQVLLPLSARSIVSVTNLTAAKVTSTSFGRRTVKAEVEAQEPSLVVVAQTWFHPWRAYVDGKRVALLRANYAFQAVQVPAGRHELRLVYQDEAFWWGAALSLLTATGLLIFWFWSGQGLRSLLASRT